MSTTTRTVMFTDLANYTAKVSSTNRDGMLALLSDHERLVRPIVEQHGGWVVKNIGDSFMCLFVSATEALRASLEILDIVNQDNSEAPLLRVAVNSGDIEEIDGDAFGATVNIAARILSKTPAGECWLGPTTRMCMNAAELPWQPVGEFNLKGIPEPQLCYRLVPRSRTWLPSLVSDAARQQELIVMHPGDPMPRIRDSSVLIFVEFRPDDPALAPILGELTDINPAAVFLAAYKIAPGDRTSWRASGHGLVIGEADVIRATIESERTTVEELDDDVDAFDDGSTMCLDGLMSCDYNLLFRGIALPAVPFMRIISSYSYVLTSSGEWLTNDAHPLVRVEVQPDGVRLRALAADISVGGRMFEAGEAAVLDTATQVTTPLGCFRYQPLAGRYRGLLVAASGAAGIALHGGREVELGRQPAGGGLSVHDTGEQSNLRWCSGRQAARARNSGFTFERVLVGRKHATVTLADDQLVIGSTHERCPTYVLDKDRLREARAGERLSLGDLLIVGTRIVGARGDNAGHLRLVSAGTGPEDFGVVGMQGALTRVA